MPDPVSTNAKPHIAKRFGIVLFAYVLVLLLSALHLFPWLPKSWAGWVVFLVAAPPLYLLGAWLGERFGGDWWEGSIIGKIAKVLLIIVLASVSLIVVLFVQDLGH